MSTTQAVLNHHLQCFGTNDLEGILSDYTVDSVVLTPEGAIRGLSAIRSFFTAALAEFGQPGTTFALKTVLIEGDCAFIVWDAETVNNRFDSATDTFVIRDGRIAVQTYVPAMTPKSADRTSASSAREQRETESVA
jgi:hypothetical protein